ncbi:MAG TPA: hypothetical protein VLB75_09990 [Steroidobacteraceae bacterium]|nr:hypothetical protein [Steroidobacteraceae bacterium]
MRTLLHRQSTGACRATLVCSALVILAACQQGKQPPAAPQGQTELAWARAALERNPNLEVVATDPQAGVLTVRDRNTGEVHAVKLNEIAAAPLAELVASAPATSAEPAKDASANAHAPATTAASPSESTPLSPASAANATASTSSGPHPYTIERSEGQIKVSGPGISIVSSGPPAGAAAQAAAAHTVDPIICEGERRIQLDGRDIRVDGDAVTARAGCELYITNSRIVASGMGVVAQDAVVHIANSYVEGASGSFAADGRSRMFLRGSTFNGLSRRDSLASVQDQGGNQWR